RHGLLCPPITLARDQQCRRAAITTVPAGTWLARRTSQSWNRRYPRERALAAGGEPARCIALVASETARTAKPAGTARTRPATVRVKRITVAGVINPALDQNATSISTVSAATAVSAPPA